MIFNYLFILFALCITSCSASEKAENADLIKAIKIIVRDYIRNSISINVIFLSENSWNDSILSRNEVLNYLNSELIPRYTSLDNDDRQKASDVIIMTNSLEYSLSILKYQLTVTTRWFIIKLSHCNKNEIMKFDKQNALRIKFLCYYNGRMKLMSMTPNRYRKCKSTVTDIRNFYISNDTKNCPMTISAVIRPPFVYVNNSQNVTGIDIRLLREIASRFNLNLQIFASNCSNLTNNEVDVHLGYPFQYNKTIKLLTSKPFDFHEFVYVAASGKRISSLEKLFQAFDGKIWILICLIILMAFMSTYAMNTQSLGIRKFIFGRDAHLKFMNVLGGLLGTSSHQLASQRNFIRILWIAFLFFGLLMRTLHQATLFKLLQNDDSKKEVQSLDEAIEKDLTVYTDVMYMDFVNKSMRYEASFCENYGNNSLKFQNKVHQSA